MHTITFCLFICDFRTVIQIVFIPEHLLPVRHNPRRNRAESHKFFIQFLIYFLHLFSGIHVKIHGKTIIFHMPDIVQGYIIFKNTGTLFYCFVPIISSMSEINTSQIIDSGKHKISPVSFHKVLFQVQEHFILVKQFC